MLKNKTRLDLFENNWYSPGAGKFKLLLWYVINVLFFINPLNPFTSLKVTLLRLFGAKIGRGVIIKPGVNIKYPWKLRIGDWSWIGEGVWIDNLAYIAIEKHVCVSQGAMLLTGNHNYKKSTFDLMIGPITLEEGSWIGAKAIVCPGIICHSHSILSVGSIATSHLDPWSIYQGNPAKLIRKRQLN